MGTKEKSSPVQKYNGILLSVPQLNLSCAPIRAISNLNEFEAKLLYLLHVKIFPFKNIVTSERMFCNMKFSVMGSQHIIPLQ